MAAMSLGRRPQLIAALLANISYYEPFIHTKRSSRPGGTSRTFWEPDPTAQPRAGHQRLADWPACAPLALEM